MKVIQDIIGKGGDFTIGFFVGSFSAIAEENRDKFSKRVFSIVAVVIVHLKPEEKEFHQNVSRKWAGQELGNSGPIP